MIHEARFMFESEYSDIIFASLSPEEEVDFPGRTLGTCTCSAGKNLEVTIQAADLSSLRAALNSWLRLVQVSEEMSHIAKNCMSTT